MRRSGNRPGESSSAWSVHFCCSLSLSFVARFFPPDSLYQLTGDPFSSVAFLLIPLSISIAILRYRLWDIDTLINKALVYGSLTSLLAALYTGLILGLDGACWGHRRPDGADASGAGDCYAGDCRAVPAVAKTSPGSY